MESHTRQLAAWTAAHDNGWTTGVTENPDGAFEASALRMVDAQARGIRTRGMNDDTGPMGPLERREYLAVLIERVLDAELSASDALAAADALPDIAERDRVFDDAWHALVHFQADEDIRARDSDYAAYQRSDLADWVQRLRVQPGKILGL